MSTPLNVLFIEDNEDDARLEARELKRGGFEVTFQRVETPAALRAALLPSPSIGRGAGGEGVGWDVILCDYNLPAMNGQEALEIYRQSDLDIPFIFVTDSFSGDTAVEALKAGAHNYVAKSDLNRLAPAVRQELENAATRRAKRQAEEQLRQNEERFRALIENATDLILVLNPDGTGRYVSPSVQRILGFAPDEIIGQSIADFVHPADLPAALEAIAIRAQPPGLADRVSEFRIRHKDGSFRVMEVIGNNLLENPAVNGIVVNARDITERKEAEEALIENEERFSAFMDNSPAVAWMKDAGDWKFRYVNREFERTFQTTRAEISIKTDFDLWPEIVAQALRQNDLAVLASDKAIQTFEDVPLPDGGLRNWLVFKFPLKLGSGKQYVAGTAVDITERKQAEEQARRNAARAEALVRTASRLNAQLDLEGVLQAVCEETARALDVEIVALDMFDEASGNLHCVAVYGAPPEFHSRHTPTPRSVFEAAEPRPGEALIVPDIQAVPGLPDAGIYAEFNVRTVAVLGLRRDSLLIGTLNLITRERPRAFTADELALFKGLADQAAQAIINARLYKETQHRLKNIQALRAIDQAITGSLDLKLTLNVVLNQVVTQLEVDAADVLLLNPHTQTLEFAAGRGFRGKGIEKSRQRLGEGHAGRAALERRTVSVHSLRSDIEGFVRAGLLAGEEFDCYHGAPLIAKGQVRGVLEVFLRSHRTLDDEWLEFLETLAGQIAIAVDNASLFDGLQRANTDLVMAYDATIEGWSNAMDLRDKETEGHTQRVTEMTVRIARAMGMSEEELVHVRRGALLHDMGKLGVPDGILLKPGPLTDDEWKIMRQHPQYAFNMLAPVTYLRPALDIPYCHHEKWDGGAASGIPGYPRGLKGEQIPLAARIFAVVDVFDSLTSERPYRKAWTKEKTLEHIQAGAGSHFDPKVVEAFLRLQI